jgi:hypothetical protein
MDEGRKLEEAQFAPSADNSAAPAGAMKLKMFSMKAGENAEGSAASKRV